VRRADPGGEHDDPTLLEMPDRAERDVGLRDLRHVNRRLDPRRYVDLLERVLQREGVHHGGEHAHVVRARAIDPRGLAPAEDVAAADDDGALHPEVDHVGELAREQARGLRRDAVARVHRGEGVPRELEQHTVVDRPDRLLRVFPFRHDAHPTRSPRRADTERTGARPPSPRPWTTSRRGAAGSSSSRPSRTAGPAGPSPRRTSSACPRRSWGPHRRACPSPEPAPRRYVARTRAPPWRPRRGSGTWAPRDSRCGAPGPWRAA